MKRKTIVVMVKLVVDTSLQNFSDTCEELRENLKMKVVGSDAVVLLEAGMLGCIEQDGA